MGDPATRRGGIPSWNNTTNFAPTNTNLASCSNGATWTSSNSGRPGEPADQLRDLVGGVRVLHLGRGFLAERGGVGVRGGGREPAALRTRGGRRRLGPACPGAGCAYAVYDCQYPSGIGAPCPGAQLQYIAPVGYADAGAALFGQLDMAGEVWEWTLDWYQSSYVDPCSDCANLSSASQRDLRGGGYYAYSGSLLSSFRASGPNRSPLDPTTRNAGSGFRCARAP